jgi:light-regulated signal transduction histidine kinase (bacteriophytochrome)
MAQRLLYERVIQEISIDLEESVESERRCKEMLEQSNKLKDLFVDILRDDLLDSVEVVKAYAETLLENKAAPLEEFLNVILQNTYKAIDIIQDASRLAKLDAGNESEMPTADLCQVAREVIDNEDDKAPDSVLP